MASSATKILVIDNRDSFVFNIVQYLRELSAEVSVVNADESADFQMASAKNFAGILISPGPGKPEECSLSLELVKYCAEAGIPLLGVCLGLQIIAVAFGAQVSSASELIHGRTSIIKHGGKNIFKDIPSNFSATRYHSLAIVSETIPSEFEVLARSLDGTIMGVAHKTFKISGVQFHPEAVLTEHGYEIFANWLELCGQVGARNRAVGLSPNLITT